MDPKEYQEMMNKRPYTGLQLVHMTYEEAYKFAGEYGMNAIITTFKPPYKMEMVRLYQKENGKLILGNMLGWNCYNAIELDKETYDIYWIGANN